MTELHPWRKPRPKNSHPKYFLGCRQLDREVLFGNEYDGWETVNPAVSQKVFNHSPDGFNWGYAGSGPSQLALGILLHLGYDQRTVISLYQRFKDDVLVGRRADHIVLPEDLIRCWVADARTADLGVK